MTNGLDAIATQDFTPLESSRHKFCKLHCVELNCLAEVCQARGLHVCQKCIPEDSTDEEFNSFVEAFYNLNILIQHVQDKRNSQGGKMSQTYLMHQECWEALPPLHHLNSCPHHNSSKGLQSGAVFQSPLYIHWGACSNALAAQRDPVA